MRFLGRLLAASVLIAAATASAAAEELRLDPSALDTSGAASKTKAKKPAKAKPDAAAAKPAKPNGDRQFGELEGWSPGKAPPGAKQDETPGGPAKGPVSIGPSGNMSVGLPF